MSGNKDDLALRALGNTRFAPEMAVEYVDKEGLKALCEELGLLSSGTKGDLQGRVVNVLRSLRALTPAGPAHVPQPYLPPSPNPPMSRPPEQQYSRPTTEESQFTSIPKRELPAPDMSREIPLEYSETPPPTLIPESTAPQLVQLQKVVEFLEDFRPTQRYRDEHKYEIELAQAMRSHFQPENVKTQATIPGGRIDIEVLGVGVEIKVPSSRAQLLTLVGQMTIYRNYYGPNAVVVVFNDFAKYQDINEFRNILQGRGIQVFVK